MPRENRETEEERKAKTAYDLIRYRLEKLQENPEKLAPLPLSKEAPKEKPPPEYVRNVVGSSAAAGSADFHIYRNNRRNEMNRLANMEQESKEKQLDEEFRQRAEERRKAEEEKLQKNQKKRQKRKQREKELRASKKAKKEDVIVAQE
ncbi:hypothetical protein M3Y97_00199500 [Aphelenchoides bicaudatus]|nr:hypothetical protein M3Y97_00199500 [Aphelenchoides bicaudatus]